MAKDKVAHVRTAKPKTPKQLAKAAANVAAYNRRNERLKERNKADAERRKELAAKFHKDRNDKAYIDAAMNGPHAFILNRWLKGREATIERVVRFFQQRPHFTQPDTQLKVA
jgi:hypothetical protein